MRGLVAALLGLTGLMLWFGAGGASSSSVPACQTSQLAVRHSETGAGLGHAGFVLKLTNRSSHPCAIGGYVGLLRLDVHRRPLPTVVRRGSGYLFSSARPRTINLAPGHSVYAGVEWIDGPVGNEPASCGTSGHDLEVTPPNQTTHLTIYAPTGACAHGTLNTTAIQLAPLGHGLVHFIA